MTVSFPQRIAVRVTPNGSLPSSPGQLMPFADDVVGAQLDAPENVPVGAVTASEQLELRRHAPNKQWPGVTHRTSRPIKSHGGKQSLAPWIVSRVPPRVQNANQPAADDRGWVHFVEPYFGGGSILFALDPDGISEVVNDRSGELTNFWDVLRSPEQFPRLHDWLQNTPCSQIEFERSLMGPMHADPVVRAPAAMWHPPPRLCWPTTLRVRRPANHPILFAAAQFRFDALGASSYTGRIARDHGLRTAPRL